MPFAKWPDFESCVLEQTKNGHPEDSAKRICGAIKSRVEKNSEQFELNEDEKKCVEQYVKVEEVKVFAELEAEIFIEIANSGTSLDNVIAEIDKRL